jgi:hypothetical protein
LLCGNLGEIVDAIFRLDAGEPGKRNPAGIETAAYIGSSDLCNGTLIEAEKNICPSRLCLLRGVSHAVSRSFESIFTAASIVI